MAYGNTGLTLGRSEWARKEDGRLQLTGKSMIVREALEFLDDLGKLPEIGLPPNTPPELVEKIREQLRDRIRGRVLDFGV